MSAAVFTACERLLSATANGLYQGILVALLAGLSLRWFVRTNAATRHAVWFGVLLFVTALIPAHLVLARRPHPLTLASVSPPVADGAAAALAPSPADMSSGPPLEHAAISDSQSDKSQAEGIEGAAYSPAAGPRVGTAGEEIDSDTGAQAVASRKSWSRFATMFLKPFSWNPETTVSLPHSICLGLVSAWVLLAGIRGGLIAVRLAEVRRIKRISRVPTPGLQELFDRVRDSLVSKRDVQLRISGAHRTAVLLGFVHPVVLLPAEMDEDANDGEVGHVLRHELAHVDRRDDWGNLAQQLIQTALFFHPAVWWICAKLSLEREIACDDYVLAAGDRPRDYALTLANVAGRMRRCRHLLAPGVFNHNSQLQQRITMILNTRRDRSPRLAGSRLGLLTTTTALLAVLAINAGPRLVLAQSAATTPAAPVPVNAATPPTPALVPDVPVAESGPRFKPAPNENDYTPAVPTPPVAPAALPPQLALQPQVALSALPSVTSFQVQVSPESPSVTPRPAVVVAGASFGDEPSEPEAPPAPRSQKRYMSIEKRLDRIERMLEDLEARGIVKGRPRGGDLLPPDDARIRPDAPRGLPINPNADWSFNRDAKEKMRAAVEAGKFAEEEEQLHADKAKREIAEMKYKEMERSQKELRDGKSEGPARELQALRQARDSLGRELQNLERQIKRLEEDRNRQMKPGPGRSGDDNDGPKPESPAGGERQ